jgi:hypothetical protein
MVLVNGQVQSDATRHVPEGEVVIELQKEVLILQTDLKYYKEAK